nr:MAG TPA: hypothetical protein [Caudoviricetes sp.]
MSYNLLLSIFVIVLVYYFHLYYTIFFGFCL